MGSSKILIDTSVIIDYLRSRDKKNSTFIDLFKRFDLCISSISVFELYNGATDDSKQKDIDTIVNKLEILPLDADCAIAASEIFRQLRKKNKGIEIRDLLIGATAYKNKLPVATLNTKHFQRLPVSLLFSRKE